MFKYTAIYGENPVLHTEEFYFYENRRLTLLQIKFNVIHVSRKVSRIKPEFQRTLNPSCSQDD